MGLSDELEALRQSGRVKTHSASLRSIKTDFTSPEAEAEKRKLKSQQDKQARLDAQKAIHSGGHAATLNDLNLLYKKLITEQREKKLVAEKNLHEWRKKWKGKKKADGKEEGEEVEEEPPMPTEDSEAEVIMNKEALSMLPEHVVAALTEKYETDDAALALSLALKEESEHGKGTLAQLMEVPPSPEKKAQPSEEKKEETKEDEKAKEEPVVKEEEEAKTELPAVEEEKDVEEKKEPEEQPPVEEVREKIEQLSIEDNNEPTKQPQQPDLSTIDRTAQTKIFYNIHSQEYIDNLTSHNTTLAPTSHRDAFVAHVHLQQHLNADDPTTMIDLGCGYGRDTLHFSQLGHHVLGIDYSYKMLDHAKKIAPKAHYLNIDMRYLKNVLVDQSVDGVWASASLLHLPKADVLEVMRGLYAAVKVGGVLYLSLKIRNVDELEEQQSDVGVGGEVFKVDERYTASTTENDITTTTEEGDDVVVDTRMKLYSYYTIDEVKGLLSNSGWELMEIDVDDRREKSDYVKHSMLIAFATRRKE